MRHGVRVRPAEWPGWCRGARQKTPDFRDSGAQVPSCPGCQRKKTRLFGVTETHISADELSWYSIFALLSWVFACAHYPSREINDRKLRARKFGAMSLVEISTGDASRGFRSRRSADAHSRSRFTTPTRFAKLQVRTRPDPPTYPFRIYIPFIAPRSIKTPSQHRADLVTPFLGTTKRFQDHHHDERLQPVDPGQARAPPSWLQARRASRPRRIRDARRHLRSPSHQDHRQVHAGLGAPGGWARPRENFSISAPPA